MSPALPPFRAWLNRAASWKTAAAAEIVIGSLMARNLKVTDSGMK